MKSSLSSIAVASGLNQFNASQIQMVSRCKCNAYTVFISGKSRAVSMSKETMEEVIGGPVPDGKLSLGMMWACDHCINKDGIDQCPCGCGREDGSCEFSED